MTRIYHVLFATLPLFLTGCIETKNVNTFSSSVAEVTAVTSNIIDSDRATCANINATIAEIDTLPRTHKITPVDCATQGKVLDSIAGTNKILDNYGKALGNISQDTFINYDNDVSTLQTVFKSLPEAQRPTQDQINAVSGLAGWVASLATQEEREKALNGALIGKNGEMKSNFHNVTALLRQLVTQYSEELDINAQITTQVLNRVSHDYASTEPVAVAEMSLRLAGNTQVNNNQKAAIKQYITSLDAMDKAFDATTEKPTAKELLPEVRNFAIQARNMYQPLAKAYSK